MCTHNRYYFYPKNRHSYPMIMLDGTIEELYYYFGNYYDKFGKIVNDIMMCNYIYK